MRPRLGANVDHVATVRQARRTVDPDPVQAALMAELAGAHGITVHIRQDRRHIQDRDLEVLRRVVKTRLNVEMAAVDEMVEIALRVKPHQVTLVPERREEITTEGGLDVAGQAAVVAQAVKRLQGGGIHVSLFVDPVGAQMEASRQVGAAAVEINTAAYSEAAEGDPRAAALDTVRAVARQAAHLGLDVHAGHGLDYRNVAALAAVPELQELNIGHSIVARAVLVGFERAVREMLEAMRGGV